MAAQQGKEETLPHSALDYKTYRDRVEPIFLKLRKDGVRCYDCHSVLTTRLRLQPFLPGQTAWTEEQSHQNFEKVSELIVPAEPMKSRFLLHPLAKEAGGDPSHTGGKFWPSRSDPEWKMLAEWVSAARPNTGTASRSDEASALDFEFFKTRVEPILLRARPGHARCYGCHSEEGRPFYLQTLLPGKTDWTAEQSRKNFASALEEVVPGDPSQSRLLLHPLAPESGGDPFHSGGRQFATQNDPDWLTIACWVRADKAEAANKAPTSSVRIYVTNSAGDTIDVIDPATNKVVQVVTGIELPHGIAFSSDGAQVYLSNELERVLDVVDRKSGTIIKKIPLTARPNNIAITKDGSRVLVGIRSEPGLVDVIATRTLTRVKSIPVNGSVHNVFVTPDGKYAVTGSLESKVATVIDLATEQVVWEVKFDHAVRPMAFDTNPDGSTSRIFVQLSGFNGFAVVDFSKRAEVARIELPDHPSGFGAAEGRTGTPSHGIGVAPDGKSLWVNSTIANAVFKYSLPDLKFIGYATLPEVHSLGGKSLGAVPEWITFTPDGNLVYVSNSGARSVSAIDTNSLKTVAIIPVGEVPKRIKTLVLN